MTENAIAKRRESIFGSVETAGIAAGGRVFLLLGGPYGPFFSELAQALSQRGAQATRIVLNGASLLDAGPKRAFHGSLAAWDPWFERVLRAKGATDLVAYGDCDRYSRAALAIAERLSVRRHVFEAGYLRPDWITLEQDGVNGYSQLPRQASFYVEQVAAAPPGAPHIHIAHPLRSQTLLAFRDGFLGFVSYPMFPHYRAPRMHGPGLQALTYPLGYVVRALTSGRNARAIDVVRRLQAPYFLFFLQREDDSQILCHSAFASVSESYEAVLQDFARNAPASAHIVLKNHPLDPYVIDHRSRVRKLSQALGIEQRTHFIWGGSLADLTRGARGTIVVNSTAGLTAIQFGVPTIALGRAIYGIEGLVHQGSLETFWSRPTPPDTELFRAFRAVVMRRTQINGSFYDPEGRRMAVRASTDRLLKEDAASAQ